MNEREWFKKVAEANFPEAGEIYYSEIDTDTYRFAMENDKYCIDTDEVRVYSRGETTVLFSPRRDDLEQCTANVLFYEGFDCVPTSERQLEQLIDEMNPDPSEEEEARQFYRERMERLKADYCKPLEDYMGIPKDIILAETTLERGAR